MLRDPLAEPHDHGRAGGQRDDDDRDAQHRVVRNDRQRAVAQQLARPGQGDDRGRVQQCQPDGQVARVLRELGLALRTLLMQLLEARDDHSQQLDDDARRDVGHHAQGEDGHLQQGSAAEEVDQVVDAAAGVAQGQALLDVAVVHTGSRDKGAQAVDHDDPDGEQQLVPQLGSLERPSESAEQSTLLWSWGQTVGRSSVIRQTPWDGRGSA